MYKITAFFLTIFIVTVHLQVSRCRSIPELEDNLFHKMNNKVENVMNKLFKTFELNQNFSETNKIRLLLTMYNDYRNISENNFKSHKNVVKAFKESNNKNVTTLFNLTEIIEEISRDKQFNLFDNSLLKDKLNEIVTNNVTFEDKNDSSVFASNIFKNTFSKMNKITLKDFKHSPINSESSMMEWRQSRRKKTYNLKFWRPSKTDDEIEYNMTNRRLYNGKRAEIEKYPFIVSVHVMKEFICAGSIISNDLIITAASCLIGAYNNTKFYEDLINVRVDSNYPNCDGEYLSVTEVFFHPEFDPAYLRNNLAIVRMSTDTYLRKTRLRSIEYNERVPAGDPAYFHSITMLGWGAQDEHGSTESAEPLLKTTLKKFNHLSCANMYSRRFVTDKNFCAGFLDKGSGACVRDVGGPGVVKGLLAGVVSFGPQVCGSPGAPTVFTNVRYYISWINSVVKKFEIVQSDAGDNSNTDEKDALTNESEQTDSSDYISNEDNKVIQRNLLDNPKVPENMTATTKVKTHTTVTKNKYATMLLEDMLQSEIDPYKITFWDKPSFIPMTDHPLYNKSFISMADESLENIEITVTASTSIYGDMELTMPTFHGGEYIAEVEEMFMNLVDRTGRGTTEMGIFNENEESIETQIQSTKGSSAKIISYQKDRQNLKDKDSVEDKVTQLMKSLKSTVYKTARIHSSTRQYAKKLYDSNEFDVYSKKLDKKLKKNVPMYNTEISTKRLDYNFFINLIINGNANKKIENIDFTYGTVDEKV